MKKFNYFFTCICVALLCACQTENNLLDLAESQNQKQEVENILKLRQNILDLNESTFQRTSMTRKSIFGGFFKRVLNIVVADVGGFIKGALNGNNVWNSAGSASTKAVVETAVDITKALVDTKQTSFGSALKMNKRRLSPDSYNMTDFINDSEDALNEVIPDPVDYVETQMDSIGYYHNKIITELFCENNSIDYWSHLSTEDIIEKVDSAFSKEPIYERITTETTSSDIFILESFYDQISEKVNLYESPVELCNDIKNSHPELSDLLMVISAYIEGLENVNAGDDWNDYTNTVLTLISNSDIDLSMKQNLRSAIIVALASSHLWNPETLNQ